MRIHPILRLLYAPDTGGGAAAPAAPASEPAGSNMTFDVPEVDSGRADTKVEDVDLSGKTAADVVHGTMGPKEAGFGDPEEDMERMEAESEGRPMRERGPDGKFLPKGKKADEATKKPTEAKPKPAAKPAAPKAAPKPAAKVETATATKFKIGDEEKTAEEWTAHFAELKAKAEAGNAPVAAKADEPAKPEPKPEEIAAEEQKKFDSFLERESGKYEIPEKELDSILAGGAAAAKAFARSLGGVEAHTTRKLCESFNKTFEQFYNRVKPLLDRDARLTEFESDHGVLTANPDIQAHPKGIETYRAKKTEWNEGENRIRTAVKSGTASAQEKAWLAYRETLSDEDKLATIAKIAKEELAKLPAANEEPDPEPAKVPQKSPAVSRPFNGDRPGGGNARVSAESKDARYLREMTEAGL